MRKGERLYLSTFEATADHVIKAWGIDALVHCDPVTGTAPARVETVLSRDDHDITRDDHAGEEEKAKTDST
jgi:hypothetical protein